jgi:DNA/RNA-binding domain of Phe-tRNA-synthetase-like protein
MGAMRLTVATAVLLGDARGEADSQTSHGRHEIPARRIDLMYFQHSSEIWADHPDLVAGVVFATGITPDAYVRPRVAKFAAAAEGRLAASSIAELPEIQAWRRTFSRMGLKPTQYRSAAESLLRRFAKEGALPQIHPLIDLCNAISLAYGIPLAAFDVAKISHNLEVCYATGDESYLTFAGETETPNPREVIFADAAGRAHARRWTNRQSGYSAVRDTTTDVLMVAEAMHSSASADISELTATLADEVTDIWSSPQKIAVLTQDLPRFQFRHP